jgi:hypothetical protein
VGLHVRVISPACPEPRRFGSDCTALAPAFLRCSAACAQRRCGSRGARRPRIRFSATPFWMRFEFHTTLRPQPPSPSPSLRPRLRPRLGQPEWVSNASVRVLTRRSARWTRVSCNDTPTVGGRPVGRASPLANASRAVVVDRPVRPSGPSPSEKNALLPITRAGTRAARWQPREVTTLCIIRRARRTIGVPSRAGAGCPFPATWTVAAPRPSPSRCSPDGPPRDRRCLTNHCADKSVEKQRGCRSRSQHCIEARAERGGGSLRHR